MCWHGTGGVSNCLNRLLQEVLCCALAVILAIFSSKEIFPLLEELPQKIVPYFMIEGEYA